MSHGASSSRAEAMSPDDSRGDVELLRTGLSEEVAALDRELEEIQLFAARPTRSWSATDARHRKARNGSPSWSAPGIRTWASCARRAPSC